MSENGTCKNCYWRDGTDGICNKEYGSHFGHFVAADDYCPDYVYDDGEYDPDSEYVDFLEGFPESEDDE